MSYGKKLTAAELNTFLESNRHGILCFAGAAPYALPMGYIYRKKTLLLCLTAEGRKMAHLKKTKKICFAICKPRWDNEGLKTPCTSVVIEGALEEVKDKSVYGLTSITPAKMQLYRIVIANLGTRKCNRKPCELFIGKKQPATETEKKRSTKHRAG
jgi:hypothetical protein